MTVRLFEGPAGSGKTTRLFRAVAEHLNTHPLRRDQRALALTKIHGSRRRMQGKLAEVLGARAPSECTTLNSFVLGLVCRWRSLARVIVDPLPAETEFQALAEVAASLLARANVLQWVAVEHPLLVVDELQDLRGAELAVVKQLSRAMDVLCAADDYQDLQAQETCEGVQWARAAGEVVSLHQVHRTNRLGLLAAAGAVRAGGVPSKGTGFSILTAANANAAASLMARNLTWARGSEVAVLSPAGPERSKFVRDTLARLDAGPFVKGRESFGPYAVPWQTSTADDFSRWTDLLGLQDPTRVVPTTELLSNARDLPGPLIEWAKHRGSLTDETAFSAAQVKEQLGRAQALLRAHSAPRRLRHSGLSIHQAKNREFDQVILLWPVQVGGGAEVQRRLLYNAITRAKHNCVVVVQDPNPRKSRLASAPFA